MNGMIIDRASGKLVADQYTGFGSYTNLHRHIPNIEDGCKVSYRHLIQTAYEYASDLTKTAALIGTNMRNLHPHSDMAQKDIVTELVRDGIFEGQGNFGCEFLIGGDAVAAATRYTEVKLSENYRRLIDPLIGYIPKFINELKYNEFAYIPVPIPVGLIIGYLGIGFGTGCRIPAFTPESILDAYIHDDPWRLKSRFGLEILDNSEMESLWTEGVGRIFYKIKTYDANGKHYIEGSKGPINLDLSQLMEWRSSGRLDYDDESSNGIPKIGFYKMPRVWYPTDEDIVNAIDTAVRGDESYYVRVVKDNMVISIGVKDWIDFTYSNYLAMLDTYITDKVSEVKNDIVFYQNFRPIADMMINNPDMSYEDIASSLNIDVELVNRASTRTLSTLRNYDPSSKVKSCKAKLQELNNFDSVEYIKNSVVMMGK